MSVSWGGIIEEDRAGRARRPCGGMYTKATMCTACGWTSSSMGSSERKCYGVEITSN